MIPGWSPQVGNLKPFQKVDTALTDNVANNNNGSPGLIISTDDAQNISPLKKQPYFSPNALVTNLGTYFFHLLIE